MPAIARAVMNSAMVTPDWRECFRRGAENCARAERAPQNEVWPGSINIVLETVTADVAVEGACDRAFAGFPGKGDGDETHIRGVRLGTRGQDPDGAAVRHAPVAGLGRIVRRERLGNEIRGIDLLPVIE